MGGGWGIVLLGAMVALWFSTRPVCAQTTLGETSIEEILRLLDDDDERERIAETLQALWISPLDLNRATTEDLLSIPFFDAFFVRQLLLERSRRGGFASVYDLKGVSGAPLSYLPLLEPFLTVSPRMPLPSNEGRAVSMLGLLVGVDVSKSSSWRSRSGQGLVYERKASKGWSAYIAAEHDRGEPLLPLRSGLMDHWSWTLTKTWEKNQETKGSILIGDYRVDIGLGLLMGMSRSYFSNLESLGGTPALGKRVLRPHRSWREYGFLRGVAAEIPIGEGRKIYLFGGYESIDARIAQGKIQTIYRTGLHTSDTELRYRHTARRETLGGYLSVGDDSPIHLGLGAMGYRYRGETGTLRKCLPNGLKEPSVAVSMDYRIEWRKVLLWGEGLLPIRQPLSMIGGISFFDDVIGRCTLSARYLGKDYVSPYGAPESRYSAARNEKAVSLSWYGEMARGVSGGVYGEYFQSLEPETRRRTVGGKVFSVRLDYRDMGIHLGLKWRGVFVDDTQRHTLKLTLDRRWAEHWRLKIGGQIAYQASAGVSKTGYLRLGYESQMYQCEGGLQWFDTSSLPIRADVAYMPYHYYVPMLRGAGVRLTSKLKISMGKHTVLQLRYSPTFYIHKPSTPLVPLLDLALTFRRP